MTAKYLRLHHPGGNVTVTGLPTRRPGRAHAMKLSWPDLAEPLDPQVDYSRTGERARSAASMAEAGIRVPSRDVSPRGRRDDADELVPYWTAPNGYCRVCGLPCPTRRHRWHDSCVTAYNALASGQGFRQAVWDRDHGVCAHCPPGTPAQPRFNGRRCPDCGLTTHAAITSCYRCHAGPRDPLNPRPLLLPVGWDADHVIPLIDGGPNTMANAQTLCLPHHRAKTAAEATRRAASRRGPAGTPLPYDDPLDHPQPAVNDTPP